MATFQRMSQRAIGVDVIPIATPDPLANQETGLLELVQNPLHRPFGDADQPADVALTQLGLATDGDQDVGMVREEGP